ncbi:hypothetical protein CDV31_005287 [Fusarium ambrosium]|uniref:Uncharacterized protein n=1 Tax=Fusarium ambrosium TaxID=131363 RepID=A0A428UK81_9HYPO|nr:hypothetical protein CDV31_005287 [Fusarium ambrosium]
MVSFAKNHTVIPIEGRGRKVDRPRTLRESQLHRLEEVEKSLDKFYMTTEFDDNMLGPFHIIRGSPFNIDDDDPIDLDRRFFLPGPVEDMERGIEVANETDFTDYIRWPQFEPIDDGFRREEDKNYADAPRHERLNLYYSRLDSDAKEGAHRGFFCQQAAEVTSSWRHHSYIGESTRPAFYDIWFSHQTGQACADFWRSGEYYRWLPGSDEMDFLHPSVPHAVATLYDSSRPHAQGMLRSELRVAVYLLKEQIRQKDVYVDHCICPVLVIGFHGRFSARITQAYVENDIVIVRPSRLIDIDTPVISPEVRLIIRWLNSRPVGDTRSLTPESEQLDRRATTPVGNTAARSMASLTIEDQ